MAKFKLKLPENLEWEFNGTYPPEEGDTPSRTFCLSTGETGERAVLSESWVKLIGAEMVEIKLKPSELPVGSVIRYISPDGPRYDGIAIRDFTGWVEASFHDGVRSSLSPTVYDSSDIEIIYNPLEGYSNGS